MPQPAEPKGPRGEELDDLIRAIIKTVLFFSREYTTCDVAQRCPLKTDTNRVHSKVLYFLRAAGLVQEVSRIKREGVGGPALIVNRSESNWLLGKHGDPAEFAFGVVRRRWDDDLRVLNHRKSLHLAPAAAPQANEKQRIATSTPEVGLKSLQAEAQHLQRQVEGERAALGRDEEKHLREAVKREQALLRIEKLKAQLAKLQAQRKKVRAR